MSSPVPGRRSRSLRLPLFVLLLVGAVLAAGVLVAVELRAGRPSAGEPRCVVAGTDGDGQRQRHALSAEQSANAALITAESVARGTDPYAAVVALATAMQESQLVNIDYGDRDSVGLFQQRPSQGWGTEAQVMDPYYATNAFYDALVRIPGYESMEITEAAQRVQRSAFPTAYAQHEQMGRFFASGLSGQTPESVQCTLRSPAAAGDPGALSTELAQAYGPLGTAVEGGTLIVEASGSQAWSVAHWAVANAKGYEVTQVEVAGRSWDREERNGWQESSAADGQVRITVSPASAENRTS